MIALLVIDMQVGSFGSESPRHDAEGVVARIHLLTGAVRAAGGLVVFIQHDGPAGDTFEPGSDGWRILPALDPRASDAVVHKQACDAFYETDLAAVLERSGARQLVVTGCATDFCVDTTVRAALSRDYDVTVVADGHTTADRPHVAAVALIRHHNWLWADLIHPHRRIEVLPTEGVLARLATGARGR